ncbi:hypothetical protein UNDYM_6009 (plasmid) [Undibacterium sp. YM2]|nr:hypothetical protein UNDYM_6009 [Undibacterium sp. YM2]
MTLAIKHGRFHDATIGPDYVNSNAARRCLDVGQFNPTSRILMETIIRLVPAGSNSQGSLAIPDQVSRDAGRLPEIELYMLCSVGITALFGDQISCTDVRGDEINGLAIGTGIADDFAAKLIYYIINKIAIVRTRDPEIQIVFLPCHRIEPEHAKLTPGTQFTSHLAGSPFACSGVCQG